MSRKVGAEGHPLKSVKEEKEVELEEERAGEAREEYRPRKGSQVVRCSLAREEEREEEEEKRRKRGEEKRRARRGGAREKVRVLAESERLV
eukprot:669717-Rhodomonas_salina.1